MAARKSERLAAKIHARLNEEGAHGARGMGHGGTDRGKGRRTSVGGAMGLTPAKPKGRNLVIAKATSAAEAAAARLDELNAGGQHHVTQRTRSHAKARKAPSKATEDKETTAASAYQARSRESMALYRQTEDMFSEEEEGECKDNKGVSDDMPQLEGGGEEANSDREEGGENGDNSIIATPGPAPEPTRSDEEFIASEGTPGGDPDYEPTEEEINEYVAVLPAIAFAELPAVAHG